jgi:hypothetical protein
VYRGRLSLRRLSVLIGGLSPNSKTVRRMAGVSTLYDEWSQTDMLLGRLLEVHIEDEIVPREDERGQEALPSRRSPASIPVVPLSDVMGLINQSDQDFYETLSKE